MLCSHRVVWFFASASARMVEFRRSKMRTRATLINPATKRCASDEPCNLQMMNARRKYADRAQEIFPVYCRRNMDANAGLERHTHPLPCSPLQQPQYQRLLVRRTTHAPAIAMQPRWMNNDDAVDNNHDAWTEQR
jgi:hypothetical protein